MAHNNTPSLIALAVAAGLISPAFAADKKADEVMVVSGSRMEQKLEDVSGPIAVITSEQIEETGLGDAADGCARRCARGGSDGRSWHPRERRVQPECRFQRSS